MMMSESLIFTQEKNIGVVTLNRPKALNALNLPMISAFLQQLKLWETDDSIHAVVVCSEEGNAFCAGGDVRWLYDAGLRKDPEQLVFFQEEYKLNQCINDYPKPYIALMDGVTMGGGVGISLHGSHPVASEKFLFAMPETSIGFFPDIGASHLLARCPDNFGLYLGLTGSRLNALDAFDLGLIKHVVASDDFSRVFSALIETDLSVNAKERVTDCIDNFAKPNIESSINSFREFVNVCFKETTVDGIIARLKESSHKWHSDTIAFMAKKSPLSLRVTLQQILSAKDKTLAESLAMDLRLVAHFMKDNDFYEGVRALLVDKDKSPKWRPSALSDVSSEMVDGYFV
jgi:enoyl-CoA hydratase